jgi:hypothetical protein
VRSRKPGGSEHCATKSEGQSEDRVLPLDHLESDAKIPQDGHKKIVRQISVLSSQISDRHIPALYSQSRTRILAHVGCCSIRSSGIPGHSRDELFLAYAVISISNKERARLTIDPSE